MMNYIFTEGNVYETLIKDASIMGLVKQMHPTDIAHVLVNKLGLQQHVANRTAGLLLKHCLKNEGDPSAVVFSTGDQGKQYSKPHQSANTWPYDAMNTSYMNFWVRKSP